MPKIANTKTEQPEIRARCVLLNGNLILATDGKSSSPKDKLSYTPGGTVEFGENSRQTLVREIREELNARLTNVKYLGVVENIFRSKGRMYHEIAFVYSARFADKSFYRKKIIDGVEDDGHRFRLRWIPINEFRSGKRLLVPVGTLDLLGGKSARERHHVPNRL
jgi:ADP-ribose pyrophosphatase YjhB (NUDIX family)